MPADCSIELKEIKPDISPAKEAIKIIAAIPKGVRLVALDERGKDLSTQGVAEQLAQWRQDGGDVAFLIGGADGLDARPIYIYGNQLFVTGSQTVAWTFEPTKTPGVQAGSMDFQYYIPASTGLELYTNGTNVLFDGGLTPTKNFGKKLMCAKDLMGFRPGMIGT
jgi:hypothetical protein